MVTLKKVGEADMTRDPCRECGKTVRQDYFGYCMNCADENGVSDLFPEKKIQENLAKLSQQPYTSHEKKQNLKKIQKNLRDKMA